MIYFDIIICHKTPIYGSHHVPEHLTTKDGSCTTTEMFSFVLLGPHWLVNFTKDDGSRHSYVVHSFKDIYVLTEKETRAGKDLHFTLSLCLSI